MWALKDMGLLAQGSNFYSTTDGKWHGINEKIKQKATVISSGDPIGMNVTKAAKNTKMEKSSYMKLVEMQVVQVTEKLAAAHFLLDSIIT